MATGDKAWAEARNENGKFLTQERYPWSFGTISEGYSILQAQEIYQSPASRGKKIGILSGFKMTVHRGKNPVGMCTHTHPQQGLYAAASVNLQVSVILMFEVGSRGGTLTHRLSCPCSLPISALKVLGIHDVDTAMSGLRTSFYPECVFYFSTST